jgi:maltooligosyltrehalose trehalohydrolase
MEVRRTIFLRIGLLSSHRITTRSETGSGDRLSTLVSFEALKLAAGTVLLSPNIPLLFMGEEYGEEAPFQYFISHSDQTLIDAVRKGRKEDLAAFQWEGGMPDPQDEATFLQSRITLGVRQHGNHGILFDFYKTLIELRKEVPSLARLAKADMEIKTIEARSAICIRRRFGEDHVVYIFNFSSNPVVISVLIKKGFWQKAFDSSSKRWGGPGATAPDSIQSDAPSQSALCRLAIALASADEVIE